MYNYIETIAGLSPKYVSKSCIRGVRQNGEAFLGPILQKFNPDVGSHGIDSEAAMEEHGVRHGKRPTCHKPQPYDLCLL